LTSASSVEPRGAFLFLFIMPVIKSNQVPTSVAPFSLASIEAHAAGIIQRAKQKAEQLLLAAQAEADQLKSTASAEGQAEGKRAGLADGLAQGKKSGHDQALAEHREKFTAAITALSRAAVEFETARGRLEAEGLRSVIELAAAIARRVAKRQAELDGQVLLANLHGAMKLVCHSADVRVAVHPKQLQTLRDELPNLKMAWPQLKHVELIEDPALSAGGCRLFTANGAIDGDLDAQLDRVIEQVLPKRV
jgi:flagellar assembly protein FliH